MKRQKHRRDEYEYRKLTDKYSDESGDDAVELLPKKTYKHPPTVEKVVEEGDTLQSLAIRYGCSVAELKRLNHILNDNEIYAKGVVKVPERPFSVILAGIHSSGRSTPSEKATKKEEEHLSSLESKLSSSLLFNLPGTSRSEDFNEVIFNSTIANIPSDAKNENSGEVEVENEEIALLPNLLPEPTPEVVSKFSCSGADADISWIALIALLVLVIVAVPLILGFGIYEYPKLHHHHNTHHNHTTHNSNHTS